MESLPASLAKAGVTIMIVVVGYFVAKCLAALTRRSSVVLTRTLFWAIWLTGILYAAFGFDVVRDAFASFDPSHIHEVSTFSMYIASLILIMFMGLFEIGENTSGDAYSENKKEISDILVKILLGALALSLFIVVGFPGTVFGNLFASLMLVGAGLLSAKIVNTVTRNSMDWVRIPRKFRRLPVSISPIRTNIGKPPGFDFDVGVEHLFSVPVFVGFAKAAILVWVGFKI